MGDAVSATQWAQTHPPPHSEPETAWRSACAARQRFLAQTARKAHVVLSGFRQGTESSHAEAWNNLEKKEMINHVYDHRFKPFWITPPPGAICFIGLSGTCHSGPSKKSVVSFVNSAINS